MLMYSNIVLFSLVIYLHIYFHRRRSSRGKGTNAEPFRSASYVETAVATNEDFHYQELNSCIENNYQNLSLH